MRDMRTVFMGSESTTHHALRRCELAGCSLTVREGKPFCPDHVEENPYPGAIMATLARRVKELELAEQDELELHLEGHHSQLIAEAIHWLTIDEVTSKVITVCRLARDMRLTTPQAKGIANCLVREGLGFKGRSGRGTETIALIMKSRWA
jgi:hypothetical protein